MYQEDAHQMFLPGGASDRTSVMDIVEASEARWWIPPPRKFMNPNHKHVNFALHSEHP